LWPTTGGAPIRKKVKEWSIKGILNSKEKPSKTDDDFKKMIGLKDKH